MSTPTVCVVGAGTAGLEGLLRAREQLGRDADLRLIAPDREFRYRPMAPDSLLRPAPERGLVIADLATEIGATWVADRAAVVREDEGCVVTRDGDTVPFDYLLLAPGARPERALRQGYVWQRGGDPSFLDRVISELSSGAVESVAVVIPRGARWPLPAYELALVLAWSTAGTGASVTLITAEQRPLATLGPTATDAVCSELKAAGVDVRAGVEAVDVPGRREGGLEAANLLLVPEADETQPGALLGSIPPTAPVSPGRGTEAEFDRLISLPTVLGPNLAGVATDAAGFIEVDSGLRVCDSERIWAAGGCLAAALEHSALSARQADAVVTAIVAARDGVGSSVSAPELSGLLLTGQRERWLAENPVGTHQPSTRCLWWPPGRAVGGMLAEQINAWNPSVRPSLPGSPDGLPIQAPIALGCPASGSHRTRGEASAETRAARLRDLENRQLNAIRRREREADSELRSLQARLERLGADQQRVVRELKQRGYLLDHTEAPAARHARRRS
ncbi:MAG TPA: FAD-dependent oxidoreductase [Solirubrobacteraceae bacterium]|jgi:sulfide:quinone oxidoreductase